MKFLILPMFAFVNAGISLQEVPLAHIFSRLPLSIVAGLVLGKRYWYSAVCLVSRETEIGKVTLLLDLVKWPQWRCCVA